jgi:predicted XRE-type DNA-binding protein
MLSRRNQNTVLLHPNKILNSLKQDSSEQKSITRRITALSKRMRKMTEEINVKVGTGNIFADLGLANPSELLVKAELARQIGKIISKRDITQVEAAEILGIDQPKISALMKGKLSGFSTERLFRFLNALGCDVEIAVKTKSEGSKHGTTKVCSL